MPDEVNHGMIYEGIIPDSIVVGGMGSSLPIRIPDGNWEPFLPIFEGQSRFGLDSMNCVQCSLTNVCEIQAKFYGKKLDLSDRHLYHTSGCTEKGNTFSRGYGALVLRGVSREELWAWLVAMTREEYGKVPPDSVNADGLKLLDEWNVGKLEYVHPSIEQMKLALLRGPIWFCNQTHAMVIYRIDDRIRVFDTYPDDGGGKGSFPLDYAAQIVAAYLVPFTPKLPMPNIILPDNTLVTGIFPTEQKTALHVGGKLIVDNPLLVLSQWFARNEELVSHRFMGGPVRTISEADWNSFPHVNFKGEPQP